MNWALFMLIPHIVSNAHCQAVISPKRDSPWQGTTILQYHKIYTASVYGHIVIYSYRIYCNWGISLELGLETQLFPNISQQQRSSSPRKASLGHSCVFDLHSRGQGLMGLRGQVRLGYGGFHKRGCPKWIFYKRKSPWLRKPPYPWISL